MSRNVAASLLVLALCGCSMTRPVLDGQHSPPPPIPESRVTIPIRTLDMGNLARSEISLASLPRDEGELNFVVKLWYRYWPEAPAFTLQPTVASIRVPYHYAWKEWRPMIYWQWHGLFDSGPRTRWDLVHDETGNAQVGFDTTFAWQGDWNMHFSTTPIYPGGKLAEWLLKKKLDDMGVAADAKLNSKGNFRARLDELWTDIASPLPLGNDSNLVIDPSAVWVTPFKTTGESLVFSVGTTAKPHIDYHSNGSGTPVRPLPPFKQQPEGDPDFTIALEGHLPFKDAAKALLDRLKQKTYPSIGGDIHVDDVFITGMNRKILIGMHLSNAIASTWIYLSGELEYRTINYVFVARNLSIEADTWNPFIHLTIWLFKGKVLSELQSQANWQSAGTTAQTISTLQDEFTKKAHGQLCLQVISLRPVVANNRQVLFTNPDGFTAALVGRGTFVLP